MPLEQRTAPYKFGYDYGVGVRASTGAPLALAVQGEVKTVKDAPGPTGDITIVRIESTSDLEEKLDISAEASGGIGLFSASARFQFSRDAKMHSQSLCLLIRCGETAFQQILDPELTKKAAELVDKGDLHTFEERYGDSFVRGIQTGGSFFGLIKISYSSNDSRERIDASLSGSYGLAFSADVAMSLSKTCKETNSSLEFFVHYEGGQVDVPSKDELTPALLLDLASKWKKSLPALRVSYNVTVAPIGLAAGPKLPNAENLINQQLTLGALARARTLAEDRRNLIEYALDSKNEDKFTAVPADLDLAKLLAGVNQDLTYISQAASYAIDNPKTAMNLEPYVAKVEGRPDYKLTVIPPSFPKLKDGPPVFTPNFVALTADTKPIPQPALVPAPNQFVEYLAALAQIMAAVQKEVIVEADRVGLTINLLQDMGTPGPFRVIRQEPAPGVPIPRGTTVNVIFSGATEKPGQPGAKVLAVTREQVFELAAKLGE